MIDTRVTQIAQKRLLTLVVFMEPGEDEKFEQRGFFCCKREPFADGMIDFSKKMKKLPDCDRFVSIAVLREGEKICESAASIYGDTLCVGNPFMRS